jgi:hypothetical protein
VGEASFISSSKVLSSNKFQKFLTTVCNIEN